MKTVEINQKLVTLLIATLVFIYVGVHAFKYMVGLI